jgi:glucose-6-phosphate dehydrogenase assembly protein OpcA
MATPLISVSQIERALAAERADPGAVATRQRTSVMTHMAWVPEAWVEAAEDVLTGLAERHPSRTIVLFPRPDAPDGLEAEIAVDTFPAGEGREIATETIRIQLGGTSAEVPASVVQPLFMPDLPVFLRWRGVPPFGESDFEGLVDVVDRLIVDSTEWPDLPAAYGRLAEVFGRVAVSDIAWARTSRWRPHLATLWPGIGSIRKLKVNATAAQAHLLAGWLRSRLGHEIELEHEDAKTLKGVEIDGEPVPFPPGEAPDPADLLSDELDHYGRDRIYEEAVRAAV